VLRSARWLAAAAAWGVVGLAVGCGGGSHAAGVGHHTAPRLTAPALSPSKAVRLAARHAGQLRSVTATFTRQGTGAIREKSAGTITEQLRPVLRADLAIPVISIYDRKVNGGESAILSGGQVYYHQPTLTAILGTRSWLDVPSADVGKQISGTVVRDTIDLAEDYGPVVQGELLAGAQKVARVGTSRLGGIPVAEYTGSYRLSAAVRVLPAATRAVVEQEQVKQNFSRVTFEAWLDAGQQVRKLVVQEEAMGHTPGSQPVAIETETTTIVVTSLNQPVTVKPPPADQVSAVPHSAIGRRF